jgi:NADP-dependent 3-hydroxy acid dehydrogenase YdfG
MKKRELARQVMVITGGSSGIGLATARLAVERGARVVLTARDEKRLSQSVDWIGADGRATYVVADVGDEEAVRRVAEHATTVYGRIDTWVNDAGATVFADAEEVTLEDMRKVFDVNFWGVVHGCRAALPHVRRTHGTLINIGSIEGEMPVPMSSAYSAAKYAVRGYSDVLRLELDKENAGVAVSLIEPSAIATPIFEHAKSYLHGAPRVPRPAYAPEVVAETILRCAERPVREVVVGGLGRLLVGARHVAPQTTDAMIRATMYRMQEGPPEPDRDPAGNLHHPQSHPPRERGDYSGPLLRSSIYTRLVTRPLPAAGLLIAGTAVGALVSGSRRGRRGGKRGSAEDSMQGG